MKWAQSIVTDISLLSKLRSFLTIPSTSTCIQFTIIGSIMSIGGSNFVEIVLLRQPRKLCRTVPAISLQLRQTCVCELLDKLWSQLHKHAMKATVYREQIGTIVMFLKLNYLIFYPENCINQKCIKEKCDFTVPTWFMCKKWIHSLRLFLHFFHPIFRHVAFISAFCKFCSLALIYGWF